MNLQDLDIYSFQYNTHDKQREFNLETNSVVTLYLRNIAKYNTSKFTKINIVAHEKLKQKTEILPLHSPTSEQMQKRLMEGDFYYENYIEPMSDILSFHRKFDLNSYFSLNDYDRKERVLNFIHESMLFLAEYFNWNTIQLKSAYQKILDENIETNFWFGKLKSSVNRKYKAGIFCEYGLQKFQIFAITYSKHGDEIERKLLASTKPSEYDFAELLGKTRWNNNEFCLYGKNKVLTGKVTI